MVGQLPVVFRLAASNVLNEEVMTCSCENLDRDARAVSGRLVQVMMCGCCYFAVWDGFCDERRKEGD